MADKAYNRKLDRGKGQPCRLCSNESPSNHVEDRPLPDLSLIDTCNRIVGWRSLRELLAPKHKYFEGKAARISALQAFRSPGDENFMLYPVISGNLRENVYRHRQLARSHTSRRVKMVTSLIGKQHLTDFRLAFVTFTMPIELSRWLSKEKQGINMAWRMFKKLWEWYDIQQGGGQAGSVNLHTWKSELPTEPHYHFHMLNPNYALVDSDIIDDNEEKAQTFRKREWYRQKSGSVVPFSDVELQALKDYWWQILLAFGRRHGVKWDAERGDVHVEWAKWDDNFGKIRLMHWFNYQGRYPLEDYAKYSNEHLDCAFPETWLTNYKNSARGFGWWRDMSVISPYQRTEREKINPVTGEKMEYFGRVGVSDIIKLGNLGFLDTSRGLPVFHHFRYDEIKWLLNNSGEIVDSS